MSSYIPAPLKWHIRLHLFTNDKLYGLLKGLIKDKKITSTENMSDLSRNTVIFQQSLHSLEINFERKINWEGLLFITFNSSSGYFEQFMKLLRKMENYSTWKLGKLTWTLTRVPKRVKWLLIWAIVLRPEGIFLTRSLEAPPCRPPCAPPRPRPRPPRRL